MLISLCLLFLFIILPSGDQTFVTADEDLQQKPIQLTPGNDNVVGGDLRMVPDYMVQDQCMALPEEKWLLHNQLVFHLSEDGLCGGQGLLLCYPSQLDEELSDQRGAVTGIPSRLKNVPENEVTKRCEEKMAKQCGQEEEECQTKHWHGILLVSGKDGEIHFHLSTTNRTFAVSRSSFDQLLVLKLASAKNKISFLSREIGPYRDWNEKRDGQKWTEKRNWINVEEDTALWKKYFEHIHKGVFLRKYAGLWSIGHDLLPLDGQDHIKIFVERSECCEIDAWFLSPTTRGMPQYTKKNYTKIVSGQDNVQMSQGSEFIFRGKFVENDKKMINFVLRDKLGRSPASETALAIDANNKMKMMELSEKLLNGHHNKKNYRFPPSPLAEDDHQHFLIKFKFISQSSIEVDFNCQQIKANLSIPINFDGIFHYTFTGDFQLIYSGGSELPKVELVEISPGNGLLVRGLIADDATLSLNGPVVADADTVIPWLFDFMAGSDLGTIQISIKDANSKASATVSKAGETFEVWILLADSKPLEIWVNNAKLQTDFEWKGIEKETNKYYIGTINNNMHNVISPIITPVFPHQIKTIMGLAASEADAVTIRAKVLPPQSGRMEVAAITLRNTAKNDDIVVFAFYIYANKSSLLKTSTYSISKNESRQQVLHWNRKIEAGKDFTIRFYYNPTAQLTLIFKIDDVMGQLQLADKISQVDTIYIESYNSVADNLNTDVKGRLLILNQIVPK